MIAKVRKAIVLAAGFGTRLRPFTEKTPKPLMKVRGETMLSRIVAMLRAAGVDDIVVNAHHLADQVVDWCEENGCRVSRESEILGTGGVLNPLRDWIGDEPFCLINGDIVVDDCDLCKLAGPLADTAVIASVIVTKSGPRTIELSSSVVSSWKSSCPGAEENFTYAGIALLKPAILRFVEPTGFSTIIQAYQRAQSSGLKVCAVHESSMTWTDAGTIRSYLSVNEGGFESSGIEFLGARGSDRSFYRIDDALIVLYDDSKRGENSRYVAEAKWLASHGISVPAVLADYPETKTSVFEFAGKEREMSARDYRLVIDELVKFNALGINFAGEVELEKRFSPALWQWERDLFVTHLLRGRFGSEFTIDEMREYERVMGLLETEPTALVHRDFQSTNILWRRDRPVFIDFQGMRLGPAAYDLASLLYDPYVELPSDLRTDLVRYYAECSGYAGIVRAVPFAAVQRLTQCLGAYGRLASVGQQCFLKYIPAALTKLREAATEANLPSIAALAERLQS